MHDVLSAEEVAQLLRCNLKTIYDAANRKRIPHQRLGKRVLFSREAIMQWLSGAPPPAETPSEAAAPVDRRSTSHVVAAPTRTTPQRSPLPDSLIAFAAGQAPCVNRHPNGKWFFRKTVRLPNGPTLRLYGIPRKWNLSDTRAGAVLAQRKAIEAALAEMLATTAPAELTVSDFAPMFLAISRAHNKASSADAKDEWMRAHIIPRLGHLLLSQVTYAVIEDFKLALLATPVRGGRSRPGNAPRTMSPKTINNGLTVLRRMLSIARKRRMIAEVPEIDWFRVPQPEVSFLTFVEADHLIAAAEHEWRPMITLALRTGLRIGELLALRWQDVDLEKAVLVVKQNVVNGIIGTPKSGKARPIPLSDDALGALALQQPRRGPYVFCDDRGQMMKIKSPVNAIHRAYRAARLPIRGWHVLRHSFASHLVMRGVSLKAVQELLGHATIHMTMRYAHLAPEIAREAVKLLDGRALSMGTTSVDATRAR